MATDEEEEEEVQGEEDGETRSAEGSGEKRRKGASPVVRCILTRDCTTKIRKDLCFTAPPPLPKRDRVSLEPIGEKFQVFLFFLSLIFFSFASLIPFFLFEPTKGVR